MIEQDKDTQHIVEANQTITDEVNNNSIVTIKSVSDVMENDDELLAELIGEIKKQSEKQISYLSRIEQAVLGVNGSVVRTDNVAVTKKAKPIKTGARKQTDSIVKRTQQPVMVDKPVKKAVQKIEKPTVAKVVQFPKNKAVLEKKPVAIDDNESEPKEQIRSIKIEREQAAPEKQRVVKQAAEAIKNNSTVINQLADEKANKKAPERDKSGRFKSKAERAADAAKENQEENESKSLLRKVGEFIITGGRGVTENQTVQDSVGLAFGGAYYAVFKELAGSLGAVKDGVLGFASKAVSFYGASRNGIERTKRFGKTLRNSGVKRAFSQIIAPLDNSEQQTVQHSENVAQADKISEKAVERDNELLEAVEEQTKAQEKQAKDLEKAVKNSGGSGGGDGGMLSALAGMFGGKIFGKVFKKLGGGRLGKLAAKVGLGGFAAGGTALGASTLAGATGGAVAKKGGMALAGKAAAKLGLRAIPVIGTVAMAGYDAVSGFNDDRMQQEAFNLKDGQEANLGQKASSAVANVLDLGGLVTGGLNLLGADVSTADIAKTVYRQFGGDTEGMAQEIYGKSKEDLSTKERLSMEASRLMSFSPLGMLLGTNAKKRTERINKVFGISGGGSSDVESTTAAGSAIETKDGQQQTVNSADNKGAWFDKGTTVQLVDSEQDRTIHTLPDMAQVVAEKQAQKEKDMKGAGVLKADGTHKTETIVQSDPEILAELKRLNKTLSKSNEKAADNASPERSWGGGDNTYLELIAADIR